MNKEIIKFKPLKWEEIVLSGSFAKKIYHSYLKKINPNAHKSKELTFEGDSYELDQIALNIISITNDYLRNIINKVENENLRKRIIQFSHNENSRKSLFHIFNIELLCFAANKKPEKFSIILDCVTDEDILTRDTENYPFYLFAILDAEDLAIAKEIYANLKEKEYTFSFIKDKLSANEIKLIKNNIKELNVP